MNDWKIDRVKPLSTDFYVPIVGAEKVLEHIGRPGWPTESSPFKAGYVFGVNTCATYKVVRQPDGGGILFSRFTGTKIDCLGGAGYAGNVKEAHYNATREPIRLVYEDKGDTIMRPAPGLHIPKATLLEVVKHYMSKPGDCHYLTLADGMVEMLPSCFLGILMWFGFHSYNCMDAASMLNAGTLVAMRNGVEFEADAIDTVRSMTERYIEELAESIVKMVKVKE